MYIQIRNKKDLKQLGLFLESKGITPNQGPFSCCSTTEFTFPMYYSTTGNFRYTGWQTADLEEGNWKGTMYEKYYNSGIPVCALIYPEKYPEYHI